MSEPNLQIAHDVEYSRLYAALSTGDNGLWEVALALMQGREAKITFQPGKRDMAEVAHVFGVLMRTCQLTASVGRIPADRRELAAIITAKIENERNGDAVWRSEFVLSAKDGHSAVCQACGAMSITLGQACPHCKVELWPEARARAKGLAEDMRQELAGAEAASWF